MEVFVKGNLDEISVFFKSLVRSSLETSSPIEPTPKSIKSAFSAAFPEKTTNAVDELNQLKKE